MKVRIDNDKCLGCQICIVICPELFKVKNDNVEAAAGVVPKSLRSKCVEASESCPSVAIEIVLPNVWADQAMGR